MGKLPTPIGKQREVLYLPAIGHTVVLGTAGSGKTTLAILRSVYLSDPSTSHGGKTLLVTFNRALVTYLQSLQPSEFQNVVVENYHSFARGYLNSRGKLTGWCILDNTAERESLIAEALMNIKDKYNPHLFFERPIGFFSEEIKWMLSHGIETIEEYQGTERIGRSQSRVEPLLREPMFEVMREYVRLRQLSGKQYDWDDLAYYANKEFEQDDDSRLYRHIIIDEGQDFSPEMLRSLANAIPDDGSLTFFGDVAQQIYGQRMSWRSAGLNVGKIWEFKENYRNTKEIAQLALAISRMPYFKGVPDIVEPTAPKAAGEPPTLAKCSNQQSEISHVIRLANADASTRSVAILFKNREQEDLIRALLPSNVIRLDRKMSTWQTGPGIRYGTYHSAKGLEFDTVILPFLSQDNLPEEKDIANLGKDEALTHDGKVLYVAVTRAKTRLVITYSGVVTELLPSIDGLFTKVDAK